MFCLLFVRKKHGYKRTAFLCMHQLGEIDQKLLSTKSWLEADVRQQRKVQCLKYLRFRNWI